MRALYKLVCSLGHVTFTTPGSEIEKYRIDNGPSDPSVPMHVESDYCEECLRAARVVASHTARFGTAAGF